MAQAAEPTREPQQADASPKVWVSHVSKPSGGRCGESMTEWHPPVVNGCATGHEHGDPPPQWVYDAGYTPSFKHPANTPNENQLKHTSFKGFQLRDDGVDLYVIAHIDTNPSGHSSRSHSYQVWARDRTGNVSHWRGWMDFGEGDMTGPQISRDGCDPDVRPIMSVFIPECSSSPVRFESWYSRAGGSGSWSWDFGFNIKANYFFGGDPNNYATWVPTGAMNAGGASKPPGMQSARACAAGSTPTSGARSSAARTTRPAAPAGRSARRPTGCCVWSNTSRRR